MSRNVHPKSWSLEKPVSNAESIIVYWYMFPETPKSSVITLVLKKSSLQKDDLDLFLYTISRQTKGCLLTGIQFCQPQ